METKAEHGGSPPFTTVAVTKCPATGSAQVGWLTKIKPLPTLAVNRFCTRSFFVIECRTRGIWERYRRARAPINRESVSSNDLHFLLTVLA